MTDIIELAKQAELIHPNWPNEAGSKRIYEHELIRFAQLLTQQEPVAFRDFDVGDDGYFNFNESIKQTTPPDTRQKLDKAREALQYIDGWAGQLIKENKSEMVNDLIYVRAKQALKDTE